MAEDNQDFSLAAPEDDDMDFESSLPVEVSSDLKPRVITSTSELRDCVKTGATESTELKMKESIELNMKESTGMKEEMKTGATESIEVKETLATDDDIRKLWRLFDVPVDTDITAKKASNLRLNTIHVRGVQELSSDEVLKYFEPYDPASLEWVNDLTCNVVFDDPKSASTALIGLMSGYINAKKDGDGESRDNSAKKESLSSIPVIEASSLEVPVPPDHWILGKAHPKSKALLLRIATEHDKKIQGAGKYSEYYRKHGNPHYGGRKNLISRSLAEKLAQNPQAVEKGLPEEDFFQPDPGFVDEEAFSSTRKLRMRMRADEEEEGKGENIVISIPNDAVMDRDSLDEELDPDMDREVEGKKSIWDRLGPRRGDRELGLSTRSRGIHRSGYREDKDRVSVFTRLSYGPAEGRNRSSFQPSKSRNVVHSNLRIKK